MLKSILVVDDDLSIRETIKNFLSKKGYNVELAGSAEEALKKYENDNFDLVISDLKMPGLSGIDLLKKIKLENENIPFIIMTAFDEMETTIEAMQFGALDYIEKPIDIKYLLSLIEKSFITKSVSETLENVVEEDNLNKIRIVGKTKKMKEIYKLIGQISPNKVTVLISGESGTGKELLANTIHNSGITKNEPFVAVNCTSLSENLLESELFGHVKGSFTGATRDKKGKFELAGNGTIFLDEISEINHSIQVKLLRVLQEKEIEPVGGEKTIKVNARIIAATNQNLEKLIEAGKFREDLYYRLNIVTINLPPLRERKEDIPLLVKYFLKKINYTLHKKILKVSPKAMEKLINHNWIGNIRELENCLMQAAVLTNGDLLEAENILLQERKALPDSTEVINLSLSEVEKKHIIKVLDYFEWDKKKAAASLGISLPTLYSKIESYSLKKN